MKTYTSEAVSHLKPDVLYRAISAIERWPEWGDDLEWTRLSGPAEVGARFTLKPKGGPEIKLEVTAASAPHEFADIAHLPLASMRTSHRFIAEGTGTRMIVTISVSGPLGFLWDRIIARKQGGGSLRTCQGVLRVRRAACGGGIRMSAVQHWIAVASAQHVRRGRAEGFMQVCHGKRGPLARIMPGDGVIYYSPSEVMGVNDGLKSFTALGEVRACEPYQVSMGEDFHPFRRDVLWEQAAERSIIPLLDRLELTAGKRNWGYPFRFGILKISEHDFGIIAASMRPQS